MFNIEGLDKLQHELLEAQEAFEALDGELGSVQFNPTDPASIEQAIQDVETIIDRACAPYAQNAFVAPLIDEMKAKYREAIVERAATARLESEDE